MTLSPAIKNALSTLQSIAFLPESEGQLTEARQEINNIVAGLNNLDDLRYSAHGIVEIYEKVSILESMDISVQYDLLSDARASREFDVEFSNAKVLPGRLNEGVTTKSFASLLKDAFTGYGPDHIEEAGVSGVDANTMVFSDDLACLFAAADNFGDDQPNVAHTIKTSRAQINEALEGGGIDALAQSLFPGAWQRTALVLGLDEATEVASTSRPKP